MELISLLTNRAEIVKAVRTSLPGYAVYPAEDASDLRELLTSVPSSLLILDGSSVKPEVIEPILAENGHPLLLLVDEGVNLDRLSRVPETVEIDGLSETLPRVVGRILQKRKLEHEIKTLKEDRSKAERAAWGISQPFAGARGKRLLQEQVLINFAKTLTANFDLRKLLNHFMDSVMEIVRANRMSILLRDKNVFRIRTHIGIDPFFAENVKLTNESSLVKWLAGNGRIFSRNLDVNREQYPDILKEMELLQCVYAFPMIYKGKLIGIFNIDSKITGDSLWREELEVIFILCNYLSAAIKDIDLYHQIQYQKEFTKNILSNMNSGVITIKADERISVFNQRAAEILGHSVLDMIGSDLRKLPSPLGDLLFETMIEGKSYKRHEVVVRPRNIPLGINSYRILDENKTPIGAVLVFTDLSDLKKLEDARRKTEKLQAINNLIGKIAHEIKNPLTSIHTFTQLLEEKYTDEEFREFFKLTVMQSIQQLDNIVDKLVLFSSPLDIRPMEFTVNELVDEAEEFVWKDMPQGVRLLKKNMKKAAFVNVDKSLFIKALYYLILACAEKSPKDDFVLLQAAEPSDRPGTVEISMKFSGKPLTEEEKELILRPLLDADAFGIELNVPISQKIVEEHDGTLSIRSSDEGNALVISLPTVERSHARLREEEPRGW